MSWFLQFQGFLFLSASVFITKSDPILRLILAFPGVFSGCSIKVAIADAETAMNEMNRKIQELSRFKVVLLHIIFIFNFFIERTLKSVTLFTDE